MSAMEEEGGDQERLEDMLRDAEADRAAIMAKNAECVPRVTPCRCTMVGTVGERLGYGAGGPTHKPLAPMLVVGFWAVCWGFPCRLQRLLAFYFQKKLENEEKAVVKSGLDEAAAPSVTAAAAPQSARSTGDQEQK